MSGLPSQPNRSVLEGIEVLLEVARRREPARVRALARELGMTPTRMQRYLGTLAHAGLLRQLPDRGYTGGPGMHALSAISLSASGLADKAREILPPLKDCEGLIALGVLWRRMVSYLYFEGPWSGKASDGLKRVEDYPAERSVIGQVLLAALDDAEIEERWPESRETWKPRIQETRQRGYAMEQRPRGEIAMAVAVGEPAFAGLAFQGKAGGGERERILIRLRETAAQLAKAPTSPSPGG